MMRYISIQNTDDGVKLFLLAGGIYLGCCYGYVGLRPSNNLKYTLFKLGRITTFGIIGGAIVYFSPLIVFAIGFTSLPYYMYHTINKSEPDALD